MSDTTLCAFTSLLQFGRHPRIFFLEETVDNAFRYDKYIQTYTDLYTHGNLFIVPALFQNKVSCSLVGNGLILIPLCIFSPRSTFSFKVIIAKPLAGRQDFLTNLSYVPFVYVYVSKGLYIFILFTAKRNFRRSLIVADRPLMLSHERRLYLHPLNTGQYFSSALPFPTPSMVLSAACGFTLPQGDSRWRFPLLKRV